MAQYDLPRDQLVKYTPDLVVPKDLDSFWTATLDEGACQCQAARVRACPVWVDPG